MKSIILAAEVLPITAAGGGTAVISTVEKFGGLS